jgi:formylglycine-generating enzyme required for sulfatase activity
MKLTIPTLLFCLLMVPVMTGAQQDRGQTVRPSAAQREPRIALVIGNAGYREARLPNPLNDAQDVAAALQGMGFDVVSGEDRDRRQMVTLIREFGQKLRNGGVGLFYFAGHGVQVGGRNYLIPINTKITAEAEVEFEAVEVGFVLAQMKGARNRLNIVILDACRNNPYARSFRSGSRGLAGIRNAPSGTLIAYATAAGDVASDGTGRNGLFTGELIAQMKKQGSTLEQVFRRTRTSVKEKSKGGQVPYEYSSVEGEEDFYFIPPVAPEPPRPTPVVGEEQSAWERAKARRTAEAVRAFLSLYPNSKFESEARSLLAVLEPGKPTVRMSVAGLALTPLLPFTTVTVDANGRIVDRRSSQESWGYVEDLGNGVKLEMVEIPAGEFLMGEDAAGAADYEKECMRYSSKGNCAGWAKEQTPQHRVRVNSFLMGKYEVTQKQWIAVMGGLPPSMASLANEFKGDDLPVVKVSWDEAQEFIRRLNKKLKLSRSVYRLPSEAEWEYAARAGMQTPYAFGETISPDTANYWWDKPHRNAPEKKNLGHPVKVGNYPANAFGLFDMHGNVREWCEDDWHDNYSNAPTDGRVWVDTPSPGLYRVPRGGGWYNNAVYCRSAIRIRNAPGSRDFNIGFRLLSTVRPKSFEGYSARISRSFLLSCKSIESVSGCC